MLKEAHALGLPDAVSQRLDRDCLDRVMPLENQMFTFLRFLKILSLFVSSLFAVFDGGRIGPEITREGNDVSFAGPVGWACEPGQDSGSLFRVLGLVSRFSSFVSSLHICLSVCVCLCPSACLSLSCLSVCLSLSRSVCFPASDSKYFNIHAYYR